MLITLSYKVQAKHYLLSVLVIRLRQAGRDDLHHDVPVEATLQLQDHLVRCPCCHLLRVDTWNSLQPNLDAIKVGCS